MKSKMKSQASVESHYRHREFARSADESEAPAFFPPLEALDHDEDKRKLMHKWKCTCINENRRSKALAGVEIVRI